MTPRRSRLRGLLASALVCAVVFTATAPPAAVVETAAPHAILIDLSTDTILMEKGSREPVPPASMSKMMTLYLLFEHIADGTLSMEDTLPVSERAWRMGGSKMFVNVNTRVSVEELLRGIIVQSGNDACVVVAEALASSEAAFAEMMTRRAHELGMRDSYFTNATGWPQEGHLMSVYDIGLLASRIIRDFPQFYPLFAETSFTYSEITQSNRNPLLYGYAGADGLKTGHTVEAGYGLAASATRGGRRLVLVVAGLENEQQRAREAGRLLDRGFADFANYELFTAGTVVAEVSTWLGQTETVPLVIERNVTLTLDRQARAEMEVRLEYEGPIPAPIREGDEIASVVVEAPGIEPVRLPLYAGATVDRLGLVGRLGAALSFLVWGAVESAAR